MLSHDAKSRLVKILGLLGSAHAGEQLAAVNRANALLAEAGLSWREVLEGDGGTTREAWERIYAAGYERGQEDARVAAGGDKRVATEPEWHGVTTSEIWPQGRPGLLAPHLVEYADKIDRIWEHSARLSPWELGFIPSVAEQLCNWRNLTERQRAVIDRIFKKKIEGDGAE
jgi:hypothetical protein